MQQEVRAVAGQRAAGQRAAGQDTAFPVTKFHVLGTDQVPCITLRPSPVRAVFPPDPPPRPEAGTVIIPR